MKNLEFEAFYTKSVPQPFPTFVQLLSYVVGKAEISPKVSLVNH